MKNPRRVKFASATRWRRRIEAILFLAFCPSVDSLRFFRRALCSVGVMEKMPPAMYSSPQSIFFSRM